MRDQHYVLSASGDPVVGGDAMKRAEWLERSGQERVVARTELPGGVVVSTVFLALDHAFGLGEPQLYETMIFEGPLDGTQDRYATRAAAEKHAIIRCQAIVVEKVFGVVDHAVARRKFGG